MDKDLHAFVDRLQAAGQLARIAAPVSRDLEITEIADRVSKGPAESNRALLFEHVTGFEMPVAINLFGSAQRMAWALGVDDLNELAVRLGALLDLRLPQGLGGLLSRGQDLLSTLRSIGLGPSKVRNAPVQEVVEKDAASLDSLPILTCWPGDGGRYITLPQVITRDPETGARNVGMYRLQVVDGRRLLMHWQRHKGGAEHERLARAQNKPTIPAAIILGGDPASRGARAVRVSRRSSA